MAKSNQLLAGAKSKDNDAIKQGIGVMKSSGLSSIADKVIPSAVNEQSKKTKKVIQETWLKCIVLRNPATISL